MFLFSSGSVITESFYIDVKQNFFFKKKEFTEDSSASKMIVEAEVFKKEVLFTIVHLHYRLMGTFRGLHRSRILKPRTIQSHVNTLY